MRHIDTLSHTGQSANYRSVTVWHQTIMGVFFIGCLVIILAACTPDNIPPKSSASPTVSPHTKPTTLPAGTLLYQSDWSRGFAGWSAAAGWKIVKGYLQSDLSNNNFLISPFSPSVPNYAIEVRFQIISVPHDGGGFVLTADRTRDKDGYTAGILGFLGPGPHSEFANPSVQAYINPLDAMDTNEVVADYEPGFIAHTYRIEVQGPQVQFFIDGLRKSYASTDQTDLLSNGPIRLKCSTAVIRVFSVRMTAL